MILLLLSTSLTQAYEFRSSPHPGNSTHYHLDPDSLTATRRATIAAAVAAWNAGGVHILRGASWVTSLSTLAPGSSVGLNNFRDEVYMKDDAWFTARGNGGFVAVFFNRPFDDDIVFNSMFGWCSAAAPSHPDCRGGNLSGAPVQFSIGQVAVHEWGHMIGFAHEDDLIATMNSLYPAGGDVGEAMWRIHEDDMAGLQALKPGASTGFNLAVSEWKHRTFVIDGDTAASADILWEPGTNFQIRQSTSLWFGSAPGHPALVYQGTGSQTPLVEWRLSSDDVCTSSDYLVGTRNPSMSTNTPYIVGPNSWNVSGVPTGSYHLCVRIDPNNVLAETSEDDNSVISREAKVTVIP